MPTSEQTETPAVEDPEDRSGSIAAQEEHSIWDWDSATIKRIALGLLALQAVWRAWIAFQGYFTGDDFVFTYNAATADFDLDYLLRDHAGHLMPGAFALVSLLDFVSPLNYPLVVLVDLLIQGAAGWWMYRLLVLLFGSRKAILLPLAFFLFTPLTLDAFLWWAAALNHLPLQLGLVFGVYAHVKYLRDGRARWLLAALGSLLLTLSFFEKAVLIPPYLFVLTVLYFSEGPVRNRLTGAVRQHWRIWLGYTVICAGVHRLVPVPCDPCLRLLTRCPDRCPADRACRGNDLRSRPVRWSVGVAPRRIQWGGRPAARMGKVAVVGAAHPAVRGNGAHTTGSPARLGPARRIRRRRHRAAGCRAAGLDRADHRAGIPLRSRRRCSCHDHPCAGHDSSTGGTSGRSPASARQRRKRSNDGSGFLC